MQLFESLTGIYAGSVYHEISKYDETHDWRKAVLPGEHFNWKSGRIIGIKCHELAFLNRGAAAYVAVIRNPYDAMKAEFTRKTLVAKDKGVPN